MKQVEIKFINLHTLKLLVKEAVKIFNLFNHADGHFRCQFHSFPVTILQYPTDNTFTLSPVVRIARVEIVDAMVNCVSNHTGSQRLVDVFRFSVRSR